jgi:hypothetical protein
MDYRNQALENTINAINKDLVIPTIPEEELILLRQKKQKKYTPEMIGFFKKYYHQLILNDFQLYFNKAFNVQYKKEALSKKWERMKEYD